MDRILWLGATRRALRRRRYSHALPGLDPQRGIARHQDERSAVQADDQLLDHVGTQAELQALRDRTLPYGFHRARIAADQRERGQIEFVEHVMLAADAERDGCQDECNEVACAMHHW